MRRELIDLADAALENANLDEVTLEIGFVDTP